MNHDIDKSSLTSAGETENQQQAEPDLILTLLKLIHETN